MAHELSRVSGAVEFFTGNGRPAWHGLGTVVDRAQTAERAIELAHLDWEVQQRPLLLPNGLVVPDRVANVRLGREQQDVYLGTVGQQYQIIQNSEAFNFLDVLVGRGEAVIETAGAIRNGRRIFITARLPGDLVVGPSDDRTSRYLLLTNSHDGTSACRCFFSPVRVVCANTLRAALGRRKADDGISIRHSGEIRGKMDEAERLLGSAVRHYDGLASLFALWRQESLTVDAASAFFAQLVPDAAAGASVKTRNRIRRTRSEMLTSFHRGPGAEMAGRTLWGAYNAATHWVDHVAFQHRPSATRETRFENVLFGAGRDLKQKAFALAQTACN